MIIVNYEEYYNDYRRTDLVKTFRTIDDVQDWIFGQMKTPYSCKKEGWLYMYFHQPKNQADASRIQFTPVRRGPDYWIHSIRSDNKFVFSDGRDTSGVKYVSDGMCRWLKACKDRQYNPEFEFGDI